MSAPGIRKLVRFVHLAVNGTWLGAVLAALALVSSGSPRDPAPYLAAFSLHDTLVVWAAGVVLFTGLFFSLYTPWGLARKWWVIGKWMGLALLGLGIPFGVTPVMNALAAHSDVALATARPDAAVASLAARVLLLLAAEAALLLLLFGLSTWRPAGETTIRWEERRFVRSALVTLAVVVVTLSVSMSWLLETARQRELGPTSARGLADGSRAATIEWLGTTVAVEVQVRGERIAALRVLQRPPGAYSDLGALVTRKVEAAGHLDVDGISGATTSARAILVAAARALETSADARP